jgi:hypothetical protein
MTDPWTAESLPPELVALHDQPGGTSLRGLAGILNAYDQLRADAADTAELVRLRAENRLLNALRDHPPGQCGRVRPHTPHRWLPNRVALDCPGIPKSGEAQ